MTDAQDDAASSLTMVLDEVPNIVSAERLNSGIVIRFDDGQCAFYSSILLFSKLPECEKLNEADVEW